MAGRAGKNKKGVEPPRFDADFVRQAPIVELSAERRAAKQRRDELHRQMGEGRKEAERAARRGRRARRRRRIPVVLAVLLVASLVAWNSFARQGRQSPSMSALGAWNHGQDQVVDERPVGDRPPPSKEQTTRPLGRPATLQGPSDRFTFMRVRPGSNVPVAYDPCRPIHIVVNKRTAPAEADVLLGQSLEIINNATGLQFKIDRETTEPPDAQRAPYQPDRYPGRWAPVLVAWSDPQEYPGITGDVAGVGGSHPLPVATIAST